MRAALVVVGDVLGHISAQMCLIDDDDLVQAFFAHGSDPTFGKGIRIWCLNRCEDYLGTFRAKDRIK